MTILLIGAMAGGKTTAVEVLRTLLDDPQIITISNLIRDSAALESKILSSRQEYTDYANSKRFADEGFWAREVLPRLNLCSDTVIDGIRHPEELKIFREALHPCMSVGLTADINIRSARLLKRGRDIDGQNTEDIYNILLDETESVLPYGLQVNACLKLCDVVVDAGVPIAEYQDALREAVRRLIHVCN